MAEGKWIQKIYSAKDQNDAYQLLVVMESQPDKYRDVRLMYQDGIAMLRCLEHSDN